MEPEENSDVYHQKKTSAKQRLIPGSKNTRLEGGNATPYGVLRKTLKPYELHTPYLGMKKLQ